MSPAAFLQKPLRWLQSIGRYRATTSGGPNFAYELCLRRIDPASCEGIDLSSWQVAFNGAEPVRPGTLERFARTFRPFGFRKERFYPCYGLAESTLIVSGGSRGTGPVIKRVDGDALSRGEVIEADGAGDTARELAGCGQVLDDQEVIVVDAESRRSLPGGVVGEIWIAGKSVGHGYWGRPEETAAAFGAYLEDRERGPFLRTGDLGFVADGELFVAGRVKDLIIIRGLNHYPQDVELSVENAHRQSRPGSAAAFSVDVDGQECLVVVQEVDGRRSLNSSEATMAIRESLARDHELDAYAIMLIRPGSLPRTSSGKVQRPKCKQLFLANRLEVVYQWTGSEFRDLATDRTVPLPEGADEQDIERWIREWVAARLGTQPDKIGSDQPLVAYGIDSLSALDFAHRCQEAVGSHPSTTAILESQSIAALARELTQRPRESETCEGSPDGPPPAEYALSVGQQAIWFISQLSPSSAAYNMAAAMRLSAQIDVVALERACQTMVDRHAVLRTTMVQKDGEVYQRIQPERRVDFDLLDATGWNEEQLQERLVAESRHQFELLKGDCFRIRVFRRARAQYTMVVVVHHIIIDFLSLAIIARELGETYDAYRGNCPPALTPIRADYGQYVKWQQNFIRSDESERQSRYWQTELGENLPLMRLPTDRMRLPVQSYEAGSVRIALAEDVATGLGRVAKEHGATLFMTLLAAFQTLLRRYTGQEDVIVGTPTAGRRRKRWNSLAGYFINPVVIRGRVEIGASFGNILAGVKQKVLAALEHEDYPFALLVDKLAPARDLSRTPLFQVMFVLQRSLGQQDPGLGVLALGEAASKISVGSLELEGIKIDRRVGQFDLTLMMAEHQTGLFGSLQFSTQLFDRVTVERMALHYQTLLESIVRTQSVGKAISLGVMTKGETAQILEQWNGAGARRRKGTTIQKMVEDRVAATPDRAALIFGERFVSYDELNHRSNQLAALLIANGAAPEGVVAICMNRSIEMVVAILAVLKAGAAYLPLDPSSPSPRLDFMLQDARASILLTESELAWKVTARNAMVIRLDQAWDAVSRHDGINPGPRSRTENLAYVIYTSGSTGKPKGVMLDQYNVTNFFRAIHRRIGADTCGTWLAVTSISFDISVLELLWTLTEGFTVVVQADRPLGSAFGGQAPQRTDKNIEMSLFYFAADDQPAHAGKYKLLIEGAKFADRHGFKAIWTPERHFHPFGGLYPNPSVTSAAIATITERIQLRAGSVVLPLHNPLRVVEEWSVVDNLSGGRVGLSFASGWQPDDFVLAPDVYARRREVFAEQIETVRKLWRGESIKSVGGDGRE
ncbi:MAG TPA: MupA/Atu3671 family FMN-dependent luciferase-like monooxygenase, partial [Blastocatellia bacterium]|nr:MupA/Atu3671 family FMN-dependent luciferase-like monooxygenase [Blastocatellia bacterium]